MFRYLFFGYQIIFCKKRKNEFSGVFGGEESIGDIILSGFFKDYGLSLENDRFFGQTGRKTFSRNVKIHYDFFEKCLE